MRTSGLTELEAVLAVARHRSFRAAATELDVSTSALSHAVSALEARIGARLFNRTTRSVALSEAGAQFVESIAPAMSSIREAMEQAGNHGDVPTGTLRINSAVGAVKQAMPLLLEYMRRYPQMKVDIVTEGKLIDIVVEGFDAGIRLHDSVPQDMIAIPLGLPLRLLVMGSPEYFSRNPVPQTPMDLLNHRCIRLRLPSGRIYHWEFERHGESYEIDVQGVLTLDESTLVLEAARAGLGLAYGSQWNASADLAAGTLVPVLEEWTPPYGGLSLYYPGRRHVPAGLRALVELIRERSEQGLNVNALPRP
ncbi:LysR family transcriptional regulator [Pseudomonas gingeri]|uniref:LysR family transcriptional regulator n=1 Tax=Pseudomonas gingeri TaxID=117681 RepID=UPI0015A1E037|nr:LysR family transcriptional regulator [Pseudomonas gingeri]NWA25953.1 LysR family transcriptional regulator [Pseudomonas gingeri]NWD74284.1 LysR family transcriptional regulator [Pseudomonas gingeri]